MKKRKLKNLKKLITALVAVFLLAIVFIVGWVWYDVSKKPTSEPWQAGELKIHFLDVGQGDCILIELPDGKKMMIDSGNGESENNRKINDYLRGLKIEKLDHLIVTHSDLDHYGGAESVLDAVEVSYAYFPYEATLDSDDGYFSLYEKALKKVLNVKIYAQLDYIQGENYYLTFLWPHSVAVKESSDDDNYYSAVVWLDFLGTSALFTGDMTEETESAILREYSLIDGIYDVGNRAVSLESTEILKVAHHGSAYSSSLEWLQLLNFQTAVISCGVNNSYGHPTAQALENLRTASPDCKIYRTDECGNVVITSTGGGVYSVKYQNQIEAQTFCAAKTDELFELAYVQIKLFHTENF